ncbi:GNAT family N-acetyltransferase [Neobacillus sp. D3-1R]|uniref:GNAT family N-acetyltransferase n=1 Tax=Neobacillus sp. D3-1R TaxID=3445778 RepID=UPI003F9F6CC2
MFIKIERLQEKDTGALFEFETVNRAFFETQVPSRGDNYYVFEHFKSILVDLLQEQEDETSFFYLIKNELNTIVGRINLVDINREKNIGFIGYRIRETFLKKGIATKALKLMLEKAPSLNVSEIHAKTTYNKIGSQKVLEHNGFLQDLDIHVQITFIMFGNLK